MISTTNLSMRYGAKILFKDVGLQFNQGHRYGLVGANGSGKSTLIKILAGELTSETGKVSIPTRCNIGSLKQDHFLYEQVPILDVVLMGKVRLWEALQKKNVLLKKEEFSDEECCELADLETIIDEEEGYLASSEAAKLLDGLGIRSEWQSNPLCTLSGGYKLRVLLAQLFFSKPDVLLLDEPTNYLDIFSIKWLEGYLRNYGGMLLISSHDRDFLNNICTDIADVDYGTIKIYKGNYDAFLQAKQSEREQKEALLAKHDKRRSEVQGFIDRFGAKASKARQAQSKARFVEKLEDEMEALDLSPSSRLYPNIQFIPSRVGGGTPLVVKEISKSFGSKKVLSGVSFEIESGDRLAIIGPNGVGKSTLLEILTQSLLPDSGTFSWGLSSNFAYFPQDHRKATNPKMSLLDWLGTFDREVPQERLRGILGRVLFSGDRVHQPIETLSGGETARLILAKMMLLKPNVLIFDEPTNHLDMEATDELTKALQGYDGTLLVVSHNRYFVSQTASRILEITHEGVKDFRCSYDAYLEKQGADHLSSNISLRQRYSQDSVKKPLSSNTYEEQKKLRNLRGQLKKKISVAEEESLRLERELGKINDRLASAGFYLETSSEQQASLLVQKTSFERKLEETMALWEGLSHEFQKNEEVLL